MVFLIFGISSIMAIAVGVGPVWVGVFWMSGVFVVCVLACLSALHGVDAGGEDCRGSVV